MWRHIWGVEQLENHSSSIKTQLKVSSERLIFLLFKW